MSRSTSRAVRALLTAGAALLALTPSALASPSPTVTTTTSVDYQCKWPVIGVQPLKVEWTVRAPQTVNSGELVEYSANLSSGGTIVQGLQSLGNVDHVYGDLSATLPLSQPSGAVRSQTVDMDLAWVYDAPQPPTPTLDQVARPTKAPLVFDEPGLGAIKSSTIRLNLTVAEPRIGGALKLPPLTTDLDGNPVVDSDGVAITFDVYCKADPSPKTIAEVTLGTPYVDAPPTKPGKPSSPFPGSTFLRLDWSGSTHSAGPVTYEVYRDGERVSTPSGRMTVINGLAANTTYTFEVRAKSREGGLSEPSEPLTLTTGARNPTRAPYACKLPGGAAHGAEVWIERLAPKVWQAGQTVAEDPRRLLIYLEDHASAPSPWPAPGAATVEGVAAQPGRNHLDVIFNVYQDDQQRLRMPVTLSSARQPVGSVSPAVIDAQTTFTVTPTVGGGGFFHDNLKDDTLSLTLIARDSAGQPLGLDTAGGGPDADPDTFELSCRYASSIPEPGIIDGFGTTADPVLDTTPPTKPTEGTYSPSDFTPTSVNLRWGASTDAGSGVKEYVIDYDGAPAGGVRVPAGTTSRLITGLGLNVDWVFTVWAIDNSGNVSEALEQNLTVYCDHCGIPQPPTNLAATSTISSVELSWTASSDSDGGPVSYNVYRDGVRVATGTDTTATINGLAPNTDYTFRVEAVDADGNKALSEPIAVKTKSDTLAPSTPSVSVGPTTGTTAAITWTSSTDNVGLAAYEVFLGSDLVATVSAGAPRTYTFTGLTPNTAYTARVIARDAAGNRSLPGQATWKTIVDVPPPPQQFSYTLKGSTQLRSLAKGSLGLSGSLTIVPNVSTGAFTGDLLMDDTSGRLVAAGFLPVTAKLGFVPSGKTTGSLVDGVLASSSKVRIKVKEVKLFGAIPLAGGNNCQTRSLSEIALKSTQPEFNPRVGGPLAGTYAISDLNGCGALNGLVSPLTAGGGNTISGTLTPKAS